MASEIAFSLGPSPQIGLFYAGAILGSSFSALLITRLGLVGDRGHRTALRPADAGEFTRAGAPPGLNPLGPGQAGGA
jgi:hypothetical protein